MIRFYLNEDLYKEGRECYQSLIKCSHIAFSKGEAWGTFEGKVIRSFVQIFEGKVIRIFVGIFGKKLFEFLFCCKENSESFT